MNLECKTKFDGAFYHVLHDCVIPNICNIERLAKQSGFACYQDWQSPWIKLFAPNASKTERCLVPPPPKRPCAVSETLYRLLPTIRRPSNIVLLQRSNTRIFTEETFKKLYSALSKKGDVVVYTGRESPKETVHIFRNARVLVGYHGAGLTNAYFMNNGTRVLEITTFKDLNNRDPWRSNMRAVTRYGSFVRRVLRLPIQQVLAANNISYRAQDADHFVKNLKYVSLMRHDLQKIVEFVSTSSKQEPTTPFSTIKAKSF